MKIEERDIKAVIPYENNPRKNDPAVDAVAKSIQEFGWRQPLVLDAQGVIVAGHTRYKAAKKLKLKSVPCVLADDLTPEQIKAYRIADNSTNSIAEWDIDLLLSELAELPQYDFSEFGLTDIDGLLKDVNFDPVPEDEQPRLDEKSPIECPHCGMEFVPK